MKQDHTNRLPVERWQPKRQIKQKLVLHHVIENKETYHLRDCIREAFGVAKLPPQSNMKRPETHTQLPDETNK